MIRTRRVWQTGGVVLATLLMNLATGPVSAGPIQGTLYFSSFVPLAGNTTVHSVNFNYNGTNSLTLGSVMDIAATPEADGLAFTSDGFLGVGGAALGEVYKVNPMTGAFTTLSSGGGSTFHTMLDPTGTTFYTAGSLDYGAGTGLVSSYPGNLSAAGTAHVVNGDDSSISTILWSDATHAFYTNSGPSGFGSFGTLDLSTFTTHQVYVNLPAAHGGAFDPYTGDLLLFGDNHITQIDPNTLQIVSDLTFGQNFILDQGTVDGQGHIFVASNTGNLIFVDITNSGLVGNPDFLDTPHLADFLDDIAPLIHPTCTAPCPEPSSLVLQVLGGSSLLGFAWLRRKHAR